jgi:citrate synthase
MDRPPEHPKRQELREKRKELHGKRRKLHERLAEVCEEFVLEDLTREHKQKMLLRELQYLLDYYKDDDTWRGID